MSLLLQALQKAAKNREGGGPEQEPDPERDVLLHASAPEEHGPREPALGELPADPDALSLADPEALSLADEEELFEPEPEEDVPAPTPTREPALAPARPPERPVLRPASTSSGSVHAATILRASEARSTGALDWVRDRPVHATLIFAVIFAVFYGAYLFLAINYPAVLRGEFPWSSTPRRMPPKRPISSPIAQPTPEPVAPAANSTPGAAPQAGGGLPPGASATPLPVPEDKPLTGLPQAKAVSAQDNVGAGPPPSRATRGAAEPGEEASAEPREKPARRRTPVEVEATTTALDDSVAVRPPPASAGAPSITLMRAWQALSQGRFEEARDLYDEVLRAEPQNVDALLGLAAIDTRDGNAEQAARHYARALELEPRNSTAQAGLISLIGQADPQLSETRLKQLIAREPSGFLYFALGNLYARQGQWPQAQPAYFQAYELQPDNPDYAYNLAVGLEHLGQPNIALNYYRRALELSSLRGHAGFDQSRVQERIGQLSARIDSR